MGRFDSGRLREAGAAEVEDERTAACRPGGRKWPGRGRKNRCLGRWAPSRRPPAGKRGGGGLCLKRPTGLWLWV